MLETFGASALARYDAESSAVVAKALNEMEQVIYQEGVVQERVVSPAQRDNPAIFKAGSAEFTQEIGDWNKNHKHIRVRGHGLGVDGEEGGDELLGVQKIVRNGNHDQATTNMNKSHNNNEGELRVQGSTITQHAIHGSDSHNNGTEEIIAADGVVEEYCARDHDKLSMPGSTADMSVKAASRDGVIQQLFDTVWKEASVPIEKVVETVKGVAATKPNSANTLNKRSSWEGRNMTTPPTNESRGPPSEASVASSRSSTGASPVLTLASSTAMLKPLPVRSTFGGTYHHITTIASSSIRVNQVDTWQPLANPWDRPQMVRRNSASSSARVLERENSGNSLSSMGSNGVAPSSSSMRKSQQQPQGGGGGTKLPAIPGSTLQQIPSKNAPPQRLKTAAVGQLSQSSSSALTSQQRLSTAPGKGGASTSGMSAKDMGMTKYNMYGKLAETSPYGPFSSSSTSTTVRPSTRGTDSSYSSSSSNRQAKASLMSASSLYGGVGGGNLRKQMGQNKEHRPKTRGSEIRTPTTTSRSSATFSSSGQHYQQQQQQQQPQSRKQNRTTSSHQQQQQITASSSSQVGSNGGLGQLKEGTSRASSAASARDDVRNIKSPDFTYSQAVTSTLHNNNSNNNSSTNSNNNNNNNNSNNSSTDNVAGMSLEDYMKKSTTISAPPVLPKDDFITEPPKGEDSSVKGMTVAEYMQISSSYNSNNMNGSSNNSFSNNSSLNGTWDAARPPTSSGQKSAQVANATEIHGRPTTRGGVRPPTRSFEDGNSTSMETSLAASTTMNSMARPGTRGQNALVDRPETELYGRPATRGDSRQTSIGENFGRPGTRSGNNGRIVTTAGQANGTTAERPMTRGPPELSKFSDWGFNITEDDVSLFNDGKRVDDPRNKKVASRQQQQRRG